MLRHGGVESPDRHPSFLLRLRLVLATHLGLVGLALWLLGEFKNEPTLFAGLGLSTLALFGANAFPIYRRLRRQLAESISVLACVGAVSCLVLATGGVEGPLLALLLVPPLTYALNVAPRVVYVWSGVTSGALTVVTVLSAQGDLSASRLVAVVAVGGCLWVEAVWAEAVANRVASRHGELARLAERDPLTGLPNRRALHREIEGLVAEGQEFALLLADLDGFKAVNDRHGHLFGDEVLRQVASGLRRATRQADVVARYGGDEFAVAVRCTRSDVGPIERRLREEVRAVSRELVLRLGLSVGVASWPEDGATVEELLRVADERLYRAKALGGVRPEGGVADGRVAGIVMVDKERP